MCAQKDAFFRAIPLLFHSSFASFEGPFPHLSKDEASDLFGLPHRPKRRDGRSVFCFFSFPFSLLIFTYQKDFHLCHRREKKSMSFWIQMVLEQKKLLLNHFMCQNKHRKKSTQGRTTVLLFFRIRYLNSTIAAWIGVKIIGFLWLIHAPSSSFCPFG